MLKALVWGRNDPVLDALVHQVRESMSPLVLVDARLDILAASRFLRLTGGPLSQFGTVFDRRWNKEIDQLAKQFRACAEDGAIAARIVLPFSHEDAPWVCTARLTYCPIGPRLYGMGEMSFAKQRSGERRHRASWRSTPNIKKGRTMPRGKHRAARLPEVEGNPLIRLGGYQE
jgi:hypothetical protein